jgi:hypothetical protein
MTVSKRVNDRLTVVGPLLLQQSSHHIIISPVQ